MADKDVEYKMCSLQQGDAHTTCWIPVRGAIKGASVEIPDLGGFWNVLSVGTHILTKEDLREKERMNRGSLPSIRS